MQNEPLQNTNGRGKIGWIVAFLLFLLSVSGLVWYINSRVQLTEAPVETPQHLTYDNGQLSLSSDGPPIDLKVLISDEVAKQLKTALAVTPSPAATTTITPAPTTVDTDTDQQKLSLAGDVLSISGGNSVTLPNNTATEVDGVIGNEVLGAAVNGGLLRTGGGTASSPYELALQSCANGEILKNSSGSWVCSSDAGGTSYTAGNGLQLSGGAFSVNSPTCAGTTKLQWTGTAFICSADVDTDTNTTYTAGDGLQLSGTQFLVNSPTCASTTKLQWTGTAFLCATDVDTTYTAGNGMQLSGTQFLVNSPTCAGTTKLQWNGTAFICSADVDTDTNTTYTAGSGMQLSGTQFSVDSPTCSGTDKLQWSGTAFVCATDVDTNTTYTAGNGLQLTGSQFLVNSPTCAGTTKLQWNGTAFVCATDVDTTYTAGDGIQLSGTQFLINSPTCAGTTKLQWTGTAFVCSADVDTDTNTTYTAGNGLQLTGTQFLVTSPTCSGTDKLQWSGTAFVCSADVDTNTTYTAGNGLQLSAGAFSVNSPTCSGTDKLQWTGTAFVCATDQTGGGGTCSVSGTFVCVSGNTLGAALSIGTTDAQALDFITANTTVASLSSSGAATFQNSTNSTTAFRILSTSGSGSLPFLVIDTTNSRAYVGNPTADSTGAILVLDTKNSAGDPTGVDGAMYYNTVAKKTRCFDDSYWVDCRPSVRSSYFYSDDFLGNATGNTTGPVLKSTVTGTGASNTNIATGITGRPGILVHDTGSTATGRAAMLTGGTEALLLGNSEPWRYETGVMLPLLSDGTERFAYRAGFLDSSNSESNDGCFMKYADDVNAGEWQGVCRNNGAESTCDTNIAVAATTWYKLEVIVNAAGSSVDFKTDGTSRCQVTTNVPTGAGRSTGFGSLLFKSVGTTGRSINVDYMEVNGQLSAAR